MRIQHNIMAMNSYRNYTNNTSALSKNLEKLSSGYKINRAGDDAAGLAISEKMRAQITGLKTAQKNAKDGISLVQTAEGALTEVHDMLNRMVELADQSANGTYDNDVDRANLQKEFDALRTEIDRIADSSNFNGIKLLDGSLAKSETAASAKQLMDIQTAGVPVAGVTKGRVDAEAALHVFNDKTNAIGDKTKFDAYEITYKNKAGETKTIKLVESKIDGIADDTGASIAEALSGKSTGLSLAPAGGNADDLAEFRDLFEIKGVATAGAAGNEQGISIQAKDATSGADLVSFKYGTHGTIPDTALTGAAAKPEDVTSKKAESAGYAIDFNNAATAAGTNGSSQVIANGHTLKMGDTVYEFVTDSATKPATAGATAVVLGADDKGTVENLVAQLKKDGYDVKVSENDKSKIIFTDMSDLEENQSGTQVAASSDKVLITKQEAAKQNTTITVAAAGDTNGHKLTFNYVDENGKSQTKELSYTGSTTGASNNATNIANAIKNDADLVKLFDVTDNGNGTISVVARGTGDGAGVFSGISTDDSGAISMRSTAGAYEGKTVELKGNENLKDGDTITIDGKTYEFSKDASKAVGKGNIRVSLGASGNDTIKNLSTALTENGVTHTYDKANNKLIFNDKDGTTKDGGLTLQIGDTAESFNQLKVSINDMHSEALGLNDIDIADQANAKAAVDVIRSAINSVSSTRGDLGATQNRLEHTINNLSVMQENIQDAESNIRDVDVAEEMMDYTKNNILVQSAQAMLAQANQVPQGVLQLLQ